MRLNLSFIFTLLALPAAFAIIGQSCETDTENFGGYGICTSKISCMPTRCGGRKRCINENFNVSARGPCPDGGVCCIRTVKKYNGKVLQTPGRCLNKVNCNSLKYTVIPNAPQCPGENVVLCIPKSNNIK